MKKIFSLLMALMVVLSISARVPASLKMVQSKKQAAKAELLKKAAPRTLAAGDEEDDYYSGEPTTPTTLNFTSATSIELDASYADEGSYALMVSGSNYALQLQFALESTDATIPAGTYTISDEEGVLAGMNLFGIYMYGSILATDEETYYYLVDGKVTIAYGQENVMTLTIDATTAYGSTLKMNVTAAVEEYNPYNYDWEPTEKTTINFTPTSYQLDDYVEDYGLVLITLENNDYMMSLEYNAESLTGNKLPAGTYNIDFSGEYGSFNASVGGDDSYDYGCFIAADFDEEGYYNAAYYLVSGTVTISYAEDGAMTITVKATTYNGSTVDVTYTQGATPTPKPGEGIVIVIADYQNDGDDGNFTSAEGVKVAVAAKGGTAPTAKAGQNDFDLRLYAKNTLTITYAEGMEQILFYISEKGLTRQAEITPSTGSMSYDMTNKVVTWTGDATTVTFTVGDLNVYGTDGKTKGGQFDFTTIVINGEGGDTPTPPTPSGDVTITGLVYADAVFNADAEYGDYWEFDFYNDLDEEGYILPPYVYFVCNESTTSGTKIAGTWTVWAGGYYPTTDEESGVFTPESNAVGSLTVTCVSQGVYSFVGSFVGEDGNTYKWTLNNVEVYAYDYESYEEITLTDGGTPTPPTPVGDEITVAEAEAIAGALKDNEITSTTYTIIGYVGTLYDSGDFWLVAQAGSKSNLQVYKPTVDRALTKGDYVKVVGKLQKYVSKAGNTVLEVVNATVTHIGDTPTPPTPSGDEITVAEAEAIAGALKDNEITSTTYTIIGYVGTLYDSGDFWLVAEAGSKSNLQVYKPTVDYALTKGDYVKVVGKLEKYVSKAGNTVLEVVNATVTHISVTDLTEIMKNAKVKKMLKQGKVIILRDNKIFDLSGMQIR
ncbi:MAG: hypothetical protein MJZ65_00735 [Paludibacteraceae bacterium]|nr:hypothetical protein [Paludibacteraceae bacterium]